jgi:hypothetical protein
MTIEMKTNDGNHLPFEPTALIARWRTDTDAGVEITVEPNEEIPSLKPVISEVLNYADYLRAQIDRGNLTYDRLIDGLDQHADEIAAGEWEGRHDDAETLLQMAAIVVLTGDQIIAGNDDTCFAVVHRDKAYGARDITVEARTVH